MKLKVCLDCGVVLENYAWGDAGLAHWTRTGHMDIEEIVWRAWG